MYQSSFVAFESWSTDRVLSWLDILDLGQYKTLFSEKQVSGRLLAQSDAKALALLGVSSEADQWRLLQARRDLLTLESRYEKANTAWYVYDMNHSLGL
jgi:hypothetical protein